MTSRIGSLGSNKHVFKMTSRREETRREVGFYGRLHRFSMADEWNVLRPRSVVRKRKSEVFEVQFILGERKRKVREFPLFVDSMYSKLINLTIPVTYLFVYLVQEVREFLVKWSGWGSEFSSWEPEEHFLNPAIIR